MVYFLCLKKIHFFAENPFFFKKTVVYFVCVQIICKFYLNRFSMIAFGRNFA